MEALLCFAAAPFVLAVWLFVFTRAFLWDRDHEEIYK